MDVTKEYGGGSGTNMSHLAAAFVAQQKNPLPPVESALLGEECPGISSTELNDGDRGGDVPKS